MWKGIRDQIYHNQWQTMEKKNGKKEIEGLLFRYDAQQQKTVEEKATSGNPQWYGEWRTAARRGDGFVWGGREKHERERKKEKIEISYG